MNEATIKSIKERAGENAPLVLEGLNNIDRWNMVLTSKLIDNAILARSEVLAFCTAIKILYGEGILAQKS